jgi:hypothetical protein
MDKYQVSISEDSFALFRVENVIQVISNLCNKDWFALNIDLRHWFHEIPLPQRYRFMFQLSIAARNPNGKFWNKVLTPVMCPMGWLKSPVIGQTLTWALILSCSYGAMPYAELDINIAYLQQLESTPRWLPLLSGGGIFVILDNICIVSPHKRVRDAWFEHLEKNGKYFHAIFKVKDPAAPGRDPQDLYEKQYDEYKRLLQQQTCFDMIRGSNTSFDFTGVTFTHSQRYLKLSDDDKENELPPGTNRNNSWSGTRRQLASVISTLNWYRRVHNINPANDDITSNNIRYCYSVVTPKQDQNWSSEINIEPQYFAGMIETWKKRHSEPRSDAVPVNAIFNTFALMAVDAASKSALLGFSYYGTGQTAPTHYSLPYYHHEYPDIALAELKAIVEGVKRCLEINNNKLDLVVIATDNMTAKVWAERGYGNCWTSNSLLRELTHYLRQHNVRLYLVYVNTLENSADCPTRNEQMTEDRLASTKRVLLTGLEEARGVWRLGGGSFTA